MQTGPAGRWMGGERQGGGEGGGGIPDSFLSKQQPIRRIWKGLREGEQITWKRKLHPTHKPAIQTRKKTLALKGPAMPPVQCLWRTCPVV